MADAADPAARADQDIAPAPESRDPRPTRIFLSYARHDTAFVDALQNELVAHGYEALRDLRDIYGGEAWEARLEAFILAADAAVFVISPAAIASPNCLWELARIEQLGKKLVPVYLSRVAGALPALLATLNWIPADYPGNVDAPPTAPTPQAIRRLCDAIDTDIGWERERTRLLVLAERWRHDDRPAAQLLYGSEISRAEAWLARRPARGAAAADSIVALIQASRDAFDAAARAEIAAQKRTANLRRRALIALALTLVVVVVGAASVRSMFASINARRSFRLAQQSVEAERRGDVTTALVDAVAGVDGSDDPVFGFPAEAAEQRLVDLYASSQLIVAIEGGDRSGAATAISPDGQRLLAVRSEGGVGVWDLASGAMLRRLDDADAGDVAAIAVSPDGRRAAVVYSEASEVWDLATKRALLRLREAGGRRTCSIAFSADGRQIVTAAQGQAPRVWDALTGQPAPAADANGADRPVILPNGQGGLRYLNLTGLSPKAREFLAAARHLSADGRRVFTVRTDGDAFPAVDEYDLATGARVLHQEPFGSNPTGTPTIQDALLTADEREILISDGGQIWAFDRTSKVLPGWPVNGDAQSLALSDNGRMLASAEGGQIKIRDPVTGKVLEAFPAYENKIDWIKFTPDGRRLIAFGPGTILRVWRVGGQPREVLLPDSVATEKVAISRDGSQVWTVQGQHSRVSVWDLLGRPLNPCDQAAKRPRGLSDPGDPSLFVASPFDRTCVTVPAVLTDDFAGGTVTVAQQDPQRFVLTKVVTGGGTTTLGGAGFATFLRISPDGRRAVIATAGGGAQFWDLTTGRPLRVLAKAGPLGGASFEGDFSPDGRWFVLPGADRTVRLLDAASGATRRTLPPPQNLRVLSGVAFTPDNAAVLAWGGEGVLLPLRPGARSTVLEGSREAPFPRLGAGPILRAEPWEVRAPQFGGGNRVLAIVDGTAVLWDTASGGSLRRFAGAAVAAISPDGRTIVTGDGSGKTAIWSNYRETPRRGRALVQQVCGELLAGAATGVASDEVAEAAARADGPDEDACAPRPLLSRLVPTLLRHR